MTVMIRPDKEIYATDGGWFAARWHFSFDHYHDPAQMSVEPFTSISATRWAAA